MLIRLLRQCLIEIVSIQYRVRTCCGWYTAILGRDFRKEKFRDMKRWLLGFCCLVGFAGFGALQAQPQVTISAIGNAASVECSPCVYGAPYPRPWLVPSGYVSIYGSFPGATVNNTTVYVTECVAGNPAATFSQTPSYAGPTQVNFQVNPQSYSVFYCPAATVTVVVGGVSSNAMPVSMVRSESSLYGCDSGSPYVQQPPSYALVGDCGYAPVNQSSGPPVLVLYGNAWAPDFALFCGAPGGNVCSPSIGPQVTIAGMPATLLYIGGVGNPPSVTSPYYQLNIQANSVVPSGPQNVTINNFGDVVSFTVTFQ